MLTKLINPLNCILPPYDMHQCVRLHVASAALFRCTIKTSPCGHSSLSFLSSSWAHYNYHSPSSTFFSVFFISSLDLPFLPLKPSAYHSVSFPSSLSFLKQTPTMLPSLLNEILYDVAEGLMWTRGHWQKPESSDSFLADWLWVFCLPATTSDQPMTYLIDKWNSDQKKKKTCAGGLKMELLWLSSVTSLYRSR